MRLGARLQALARLAMLASMCQGALGQVAAATLQPFAESASEPPSPWKVVGLPRQTKPFTRFSVVENDRHPVLRVEAQSSYGNLVHPLDLKNPPHQLQWRWRLDEPIASADLRSRRTEDIAIKVCTLWDLPLERVPFFERQLLRALRAQSEDRVPSATVCYVWDPHFDPGVELRSPYTGRLRYIVLRGVDAPLHAWALERRDIAADFMRLFGQEARELPPLIGVAVGADADNTRSHSLAFAADLELQP